MVGRGQEAVAESRIIGHALGRQGNRNRPIDARQGIVTLTGFQVNGRRFSLRR